MSPRTRIAVLLGLAVLLAVGATLYVLVAHKQQGDRAANAPAVASRDDLAAVSGQTHLVFRSTALGTGYGQVALVPLSRPDGPRAFTTASCERVFAVVGTAVCLSADRGVVTTYQSQILGADWKLAQDLPLTGLPSRARLSKDGSLVATTTFVFGDSYANPGQFSTRTLVSKVGAKTTDDLEAFSLTVDGRTNTAADRNLWGVTFADDDVFYATAATGGKTYLVRGSLAGRSLVSIRGDVECPSLSPDGKRIAFKKHGSLPAGKWRLAVVDLASGKETLMSEERSVDDQAVWLDNDHVIYGLPRTANGTASSDIWMVNADGSGAPKLLVHDAWSPSVVTSPRG